MTEAQAAPFAPNKENTARICADLNVPERSVAAVLGLMAEGSTVPFIARYRKEMTGALDEVQIRAIGDRHIYLSELGARRTAILASIKEQGKLSDALQHKILAAQTKAELEDLYLPFKPKRRTRAAIAKEKGLEPLAQLILSQPEAGDPQQAAQGFINPQLEVHDAAQAISHAKDIVAEWVAEHSEVRAQTRQTFMREAVLASEAVPEKTQGPTKFEQYYAFAEPISTLPSHRFLALRRGEREGILRLRLALEPGPLMGGIETLVGLKPASPFAELFRQAIHEAAHRLLLPSIETDARVALKLRADKDAVDVFGGNLRNLLLAPPLGGRAVVGIDPGLRTGCKCVALAGTGKFLSTITLFLSGGEGGRTRAATELLAFLRKYKPECIAIGNGTGGRETETFVRELLGKAQDPELDAMHVVSVSESGASVYSASDVAREEFPELDVTIRGAISIARRLQDPLAELVKIDPKAIGVGQYQHDVHQPLLTRKLAEVVESCVNHVGVELNTASAPLLAHVAGIGPALARKIVMYREERGPFAGREALQKVPGMGPRTFEQAAGFLRIRGGSHPLDASAVHPERYALVAHMAQNLDVEVGTLVGNASLVSRINLDDYVNDTVGLPTLKDILDELKKPGRDPRATFTPHAFAEGIHALEDLKPGMVIDGIVTNVTAFGAFVDIGVHQDGLVHISQLADRFIKDAHEVVSAGSTLKVWVLDVDLPRRRIALTARADSARAAHKGQSDGASQGDGAKEARGHDRPQRRPDRSRGQGRGPGGHGGQGHGGSKANEALRHNPFAKLRSL
jgi:uncharacterized protein